MRPRLPRRCREAPPHPLRTAVAAVFAAVAALGALAPAACSRAPEAPDLLRVRLPHEPSTLDPALSRDVTSIGVLTPIFETLVKVDPSTLELRPALAQQWEVSEDGLTYTFHLREGARFHHGREVEAQDVVFSLTRLLSSDRPSPGAEILDPVAGADEFRNADADRLEGLEALDSRTVRIRLERPYAPFLVRLTTIHAAVVPRDIYGGPEKEYVRQPVGSGPFRFAEWRPAQWLRLERFSGYAPVAAQLAGIQFRIIEDQVAALEEFRRGGLDFLDEVPPGRVSSTIEEFGELYHRWNTLTTSHLLFNNSVPPLAGNVLLRRALNLAVNRQRLCEVLLEGLHVPASGILPHGMPGFDPGRPAYRENLEEARRLLAEAGYPNGDKLPPLLLLFNTNPRVQRIVEQVQIDLARIGVRLELRSADGAAFLEALTSGEWGGRPLHMVRLGWSADYPDPDSFLGVQLLSRNAGLAGNFSRYSNPEVDALIEKARRTLDAEQRYTLYREVERLAADRDVCWLFLYFHRSQLLVSSRVQGLVPVVLGNGVFPYEQLSLAP
ncbi:MAG: ABC transporter substrate-binding protein [Acidobacteriota bacterium]